MKLTQPLPSFVYSWVWWFKGSPNLEVNLCCLLAMPDFSRPCSECASVIWGAVPGWTGVLCGGSWNLGPGGRSFRDTCQAVLQSCVPSRCIDSLCRKPVTPTHSCRWNLSLALQGQVDFEGLAGIPQQVDHVYIVREL